MKKMLTKMLGFAGLVLSFNTGKAQAYLRGESLTVQPIQIMQDQFTPIRLPDETPAISGLNRFDNSNPYTYMEILTDKKQKKYQVIFQTDFVGNLLYLAISNNLAPVLYKKDKPLFRFQYCVKGLKESISPLQLGDRIMQCIIDRLEDVVM